MKIASVLGQGFEDSEFRIPYDRLKAAGYQVDVIGVKAGEELKEGALLRALRLKGSLFHVEQGQSASA